MKVYYCLALALLLFSCKKQEETITDTTNKSDSITAKPVSKNNLQKTEDEEDSYNEFETMYIVIADTSDNYRILHQKMFSLHEISSAKIDTMGRYYNTEKRQIVSPDDDEDEMYRGEYFPRRYPSNHLSLEHLDFFKKGSDNTTMPLVTGIYETKKSADSALVYLKPIEKKAFVLKSEVYIGCMH
jgi:hypothetical protein